MSWNNWILNTFNYVYIDIVVNDALTIEVSSIDDKNNTAAENIFLDFTDEKLSLFPRICFVFLDSEHKN